MKDLEGCESSSLLGYPLKGVVLILLLFKRCCEKLGSYPS